MSDDLPSPAQWRRLADLLRKLAQEIGHEAEFEDMVEAGALLRVAARLEQRANDAETAH